MKYYHWASSPVKLRSMSYMQGGHPKPNGLWFDVDEEWKQWCEATQFRLENLNYRHAVTILDRSRIVFLQSVKDVDEFTKAYGCNISRHVQFLQSAEERDAFTVEYGHDLFDDVRRAFSNYIMWGEVAEKYSGIVVHPYSQEKTQTYLWYWGWNCSGGCVWDTNVIRLGKPYKGAK